MALFAPQAATPEIFDDYHVDRTWKGTEAPEKEWDCSAEDAWKQLPRYAQKTLVNGTYKGFFANEKDRKSENVRFYDMHISNLNQLLYDMKTTPGTCIWSKNSKTDN